MSAFVRESATTRRAHSHSGGFLRWMSMSIFCGAILLGTARRSAAATLMVTDNGNALPGSLRTQIAAASSGDTIDCTPIAGNTIALLSPLTINNKSLTITSATTPVIVDGVGLNQVLNIHQGAGYSVALNNLTLQNGKLQGANGNPGLPAKGGGIYCSGGALTLTNCTISGNSAIGGNGNNGTGVLTSGAHGGLAQGGGIFCTGTALTLTTCTLSNNSAIGGRGGNGATAGSGSAGAGGYGAKAEGGGVYTNLAPTISGSTFSSNKALAGAGGSGADAGGTNGLSGANAGDGGYARGGGLFLSFASGTSTIDSSTLSGNYATAGATGHGGNGALSATANGGAGGYGFTAGKALGAGIYVSGGTLNLTNSTITGNSVTGGTCSNGGNGGPAGGASGIGGASKGLFGSMLFGGLARGGGIFASAGVLTSTASTITSNSCTGGAGGSAGAGGAGCGSGTGGASGYGGWGGNAEGGGIFSYGTVVISGGSVSNNVLRSGHGGDGGAGGAGGAFAAGTHGGLSGFGGNASGAALNVKGPLTVVGAIITSNSALAGDSGNGGAGGNSGSNHSGGVGGNNRSGGFASAGGIYSSDGLSISASTITLNTVTGGRAGNGGAGGNGAGAGVGGNGGYGNFTGTGGFASGAGIDVFGSAPVTLANSTISFNSAVGGAGGNGGSGGGPLSGAPGPGSSGGVAIGGALSGQFYSIGTLDHCILSGNSIIGGNGGNGAATNPRNGANGGRGGGVLGAGVYATGSLSVINGTSITGNSEQGGNGGSAGAGGDSAGGTGGNGGQGGLGGVSWGGGIGTLQSTSVLTVADSIISSNTTNGGTGAPGGPGGNGGATGTGGKGGMGGNGGSAAGGGIFSSGTTSVSNSTIASNSNTAGFSGTGGVGGGGSIGGNGGDSGKSGALGGGVANYVGETLTVINSTISGNMNIGVAGASGGRGGDGTTIGGAGGNASPSAVSGGGINSYGMLTVTNSTISGNSNVAAAGAIGGAGGNGPTTSGNGGNGSAARVYGGGIAQNSSLAAQINSSTIASNSCTDTLGGPGGAPGVGPAGLNGNFYAGNGGGVRAQGIGVVTLSSSIVARNTASGAADLSGTLSAASDHNLIGDGTQTLGISNGINGNQLGTSATPIDPKLGLLQNNGGATQTRLLSFGSPAVGAGSNLLALTTEQRGAGFPRLLGPKPDVGATAFDSFPPTATLSAPDVSSASASYFFTVTFADAFGVDVSGAGTGNILVTGPNGFSQIATFVSVTPAISGPSLTVTYMITPPNGVWAYAANGAYTVAIQANQIKDLTGNFMPAGSLGAFNVNIFAAPPVFTSAPSATPNPALVNQTIQFAAQISGTLPLTIGWNFGDGVSGSGSSLVHAFSAPGTYTVTVTLVDGNGLSTQTTFSVVVIEVGGDADGDGISNDVELALGSDPLSAASTPFNISKPASSAALKVKKLSIQLNFGAESSDTIKLSGQLPLSNLKALNQPIIFNIGQVIKAFQFDAHGKGTGSIGPTGRLNDSVRMSKRGAFSLTLPRGAFQAALNSDPDPARELTNSQGNSKTRTIKVTVYFNATVFTADVTAVYSALKGKFGK